MPRGGPPPYDGTDCRRTGDGERHDQDICRAGRYYGLCGICRPLITAAAKQRRTENQKAAPPSQQRVARDDMDGMRDEINARSNQRGKLRTACLDLADKADRLEDALEQRHLASLHARTTLGEFKESLQLVGRVAQSLVNMRSEPAGR